MCDRLPDSENVFSSWDGENLDNTDSFDTHNSPENEDNEEW